MHVNKKKSKKTLFPESERLYRQADETASFILNVLLKNEEPFKVASHILGSANLTIMADQADREKALSRIWKHVSDVSKDLDPRYVIPTLVELAEQYYYSSAKYKDKLPWLGTSIKAAIAIVWNNRTRIQASRKANNDILMLLEAVASWEQLNLLNDQAKIFMLNELEFTPTGILTRSIEDNNIRQNWNSYASRRGLSHRTLKDSIDVIWTDPNSFLLAIAEVLNGSKPSDIPIFKGTIFEDINPGERSFWLGISVRLQLLMSASKFRDSKGAEKQVGIAVFESFAIETSFMGGDMTKAQQVIQDMFWQKAWHKGRLSSRDCLNNMWVERPVIRIDSKTFVTGIGNLMDSINCFVEYSVFRYMGYGGVRVSEDAFRNHVSQPFETKAISCFTERGWKASSVSEKGLWSGELVTHSQGAPIPGEIDVLAVHPRGLIAILVECKVLTSIFTFNKMLNFSQKVGVVDSEGFHKKLALKTEWLQETANFKSYQIVPVLVVDQGAFMGDQAPNMVLDIEDLPLLIEKLEELISENTGSFLQ